MYRRTPLSIEVKKVLKLLSYTMLALLIVSSGYFFVKMSTTAESGYSLHEGQIRKKNLEDENRILNLQLLEAQSIEDLKQSTIVKEMTEPTDPIYILPKGPLSRKK